MVMNLEIKKMYNTNGFNVCLYVDDDLKINDIQLSKGSIISAIKDNNIIILDEFEKYRDIIEPKINNENINSFNITI